MRPLKPRVLENGCDQDIFLAEILESRMKGTHIDSLFLYCW